MRPQSCKAKGRRLQQEVVAAILAYFLELQPDDVRSTSMGANGSDILLSPAARALIPYSFECSNQERINIWKKLEQAAKGAHPATIPIVVFRKNNTRPMVALPFDEWLRLVHEVNGGA